MPPFTRFDRHRAGARVHYFETSETLKLHEMMFHFLSCKSIPMEIFNICNFDSNRGQRL